ncbi:MAG TPA: hypothetical protein VNI57_02580, partial [Candidatus Saccharimonadales bacterium]|nr:hypothetical protein [Candidatus Saccharimonadales bacterium]
MSAVRVRQGRDVLDAAIERVRDLMREGHRIVVSFSAGKDSGVALEVALIAARLEGRLPLDVVMRDEEIMYPGTYEYAERVAARNEVRFSWLVARQPIVNIFNREQPYYWAFDPRLLPEQWVRRPPAIAQEIPEINIESIVTPKRFPPYRNGKDLVTVLGLRVSESHGRLFGLFSAGGHLTKPGRHGVRHCWAVYDWTDGDVWKAIHDHGWDYNKAYDTLYQMGLPPRRLRIAPPAINGASAASL